MTDSKLYNTLGVSKSATPEEIKKAFRKKAIELHPDKHAGDKKKEEQFKEINEAYSVLSDPEKRKRYDQFGTIDNAGGMATDINDILKEMFGGGMMGGGGGTFSVFMNGDDVGEDIFQSFFGGGGHPRQKLQADIVDVNIDICDIYYGKTSKVEFELLDLCGKCNGLGASDASGIIKCMTCNGQGSLTQQIGPFFMQTVKCGSCGGTGSSIKSSKVCQTCKGEKTVYNKKHFELKIPKGIANNYELKMDEKGSYDMRAKKHKDILFRFHYDIKYPYEIDRDNNVTYNLKISLEDILAGFEKSITLYNEEYKIKLDHYINPNEPIVIPHMGINKKNLIIKLQVEFGDSDRLVKYNDIMRKIFKRPKQESGVEKESSSTKNKVLNITNI